MSALVYCSRCEQDAPSIARFITFAEPLRTDVAQHVCAECWEAWLQTQLKVINEYRLHLGNAEHRRALADFAKQFLRLDGGDGVLAAGPEGGLG